MRAIIFFLIFLSLNSWAEKNKIFGGNPVDIGQLKAVVAIGINHCTGTLISKTEVLTAAHCFLNQAKDLINPIINETKHHVWVGNKHDPNHKYAIKYVVTHPKYTFNNFAYDNYDVAYVKLARAVKIDDDELIEVATKEETNQSTDQMALISGFGIHNQESNDLKYMAFTKINRLTSKELFIGGHGTSICFGDSGGPAMIQQNGKFKLVGITSRTSSLYLSNPSKSCRDEGIFGKAYLGYELTQAQRLIAKGLQTGNDTLLKQSILLYPQSSWANYWLTGDSKEIVKLMPWNSAIKILNPAEDNLARAKGYFQKGFTAQALTAAEKGMTYSSTLIESLVIKATIQLHNKDTQLALQTIEQGLQHDPNQRFLLLLKAEAILTKQDYGQAEEILKQLPNDKFESLLKVRLNILRGTFDIAIESLKHAIKQGADINRIAPNKKNLLQEALGWHAYKLADILVEARININHRSSSGGITNLLASTEQSDLLRKVLQYGANVDAPGHYGHTALHLAAYHGILENVKILMAYGANINAKAAYGQAPIDFAKQKGHSEIVKYLLTAPL